MEEFLRKEQSYILTNGNALYKQPNASVMEYINGNLKVYLHALVIIEYNPNPEKSL